MQTKRTLIYLCLWMANLASVSQVQAQINPLFRIDQPSVDVFPKFAVSISNEPGRSFFANTVDKAAVTAVIYWNSCSAQNPTDVTSGPTPTLTAQGNNLTLTEVSFRFFGSCPATNTGEGIATRSVKLGEFGPGRYKLMTVSARGDNPDLNAPRDSVTTFVREFTVLNIEQAGKALIELPSAGSTQSGIGLISGWACVADRVEMSINGGAKIKLSGESPRADLGPVCGHDRAGFGTLLNFNNLGNGSHTIQLYVKGVAIGEPTRFNVVVPIGEFARGLRKEVTVPDFPATGKSSVIDWREAEQNFGIKEVK
jgi:hypothetical protein